MEIKKLAEEFLEKCNSCMVASVDEDGYPNVKAMLKLESEGIQTIIFSTSSESARTLQFKKNQKACVYVMDDKTYMGLMLTGDIEVLEDRESKSRYWHDWMVNYYPDGVDTWYYCIYRFTAKKGQYYHGKPVDFTL
jgi:general stress protein 26